MPAFADPGVTLSLNIDSEIRALRTWRDKEPGRSIPPRDTENLLVATWNIANLGDPGQMRTQADLMLLAEIVSWFDVVAIQEVNKNLSDAWEIKALLPESWRTIFTDVGGNQERMVFLYDNDVVSLRSLAGEIAIAPGSHRYIRIKGIKQRFLGFDRNPYAVAFRKHDFGFILVNAHLFFGSTSTDDENRRALEAYALGRWADIEQRSGAYERNVIVLGDLNIPKAQPGDPIFTALTKRGLQVPLHSTRIASAIASDNQYDQIAFFPGRVKKRYQTSGVFDFDGAVFANYWRELDQRHSIDKARTLFCDYLRYHLSDHRPLWAQFSNL